jgi:hypothetical protein
VQKLSARLLGRDRKGSLLMQRRSFLALMGLSPIAAKEALDVKIAEGVGLRTPLGIGDVSLGIYTGAGMEPSETSSTAMPFAKRVTGAAHYARVFGIPEAVESSMRDQAKYVSMLDPDIACKRSWSMSVKILTQRERNYQRAVERISIAGWQEIMRQKLAKTLGFDWPW